MVSKAGRCPYSIALGISGAGQNHIHPGLNFHGLRDVFLAIDPTLVQYLLFYPRSRDDNTILPDTLGVDTKDLDQGMKTLGASIKKHQKAIGIGMTAVGATILAVGGMTIKTASDIEEMTAKFDVVFGETSQMVKEWAKTTSEAMGRSRFAMMEMAASVQDTFVPMGFARDQAAEMSKRASPILIAI